MSSPLSVISNGSPKGDQSGEILVDWRRSDELRSVAPLISAGESSGGTRSSAAELPTRLFEHGDDSDGLIVVVKR